MTGDRLEYERRVNRYRSWLPGSGFEPDDRPCVEIYRARPTAGAEAGVFRCELCLPVRPL